MKEEIFSIKKIKAIFLVLLCSILLNYGSKCTQAIGVNTGVSDNPYNKTAQQLLEKEKKINEQEARLREIEQEVISNSRISRQLMLAAVGGVVVLSVLIFVNYYLDFQRQKREEEDEKNNTTNASH
ncbi:hypothetical protein HGA64_00570 [Candidatus Falkowbacteria bacterium]|nr:hypothetical protein [Candidatus Falkowbacteria bacterium]